MARGTAVAFLLLAAVTLAAGANSPPARRPPARRPDDAMAPYTIGLWGDLPYSVDQATIGMPHLIADMNAAKLAFTVMDGDLKQGSNSPCDDGLYNRSLAYFNALDAPAAFTPGDNDWVDCDRANNGGYNSLERLDYERKVFFSGPYTLGKTKLKQEVQMDALCPGYSATKPYPLVPCVENRRWMYGGVMYMTVNVQGSCNNLCDTNPDPEEYAGRNAANIAWLNSTFAAAKQGGAVAVMIISQGNPGWDGADGTRTLRRDPKTLGFLPPRVGANNTSTCGDDTSSADGFQSWLLAVRAATIGFGGKPVVYVHGDSHYFRVDKPLQDKNGARVQYFTRVETPGDNAQTGNNDVTWLKVHVDPRSREVFAYSPQVVVANVANYTNHH
ncbi:hypothetical protein HXX76_011596 [Chlamydomonas incerta]|uniref:Calcineurin-like phosphoesterase domain-containing protein n=1 Tax=Chlamydomonas incerta TaxID=51695 RepID=A0A835SRQ2_CHLIN|nr:hypothetical protein HXX76_011596 [Chlamydomonas incerta]|eukprot:KAG2428478.1 hypothetical protein HXX76_011596 [Chlamydomonas incerta]